MADQEILDSSKKYSVTEQNKSSRLLSTPSSKPSDNEVSVIQKYYNKRWFYEILLILILLIGVYFRLVGIDWDEGFHLHPDERFITMVASSISPVDGLGSYFNTSISSLNPNNRGYGFFVYGTLPIFIVRYIAGWIGQTGYSEIYLVGRFMSAIFDLLTILVTYLTVMRLYRNNALALLASAFLAMSVMLIQLSHFFVVDNFANFFTCLAIYFAVVVLKDKNDPAENIGSHEIDDKPCQIPASPKEDDSHRLSYNLHPDDDIDDNWKNRLLKIWMNSRTFIYFGIALGAALSSKITTAPVAILLPAAALSNFYKNPVEKRRNFELPLMRNLVLAFITAFIIFRIFQPYAFNGPGFFGLAPNQTWVSNLIDLNAQSSGDVDFPPALQWARRPITFSLENMVKWGFGLPLGLLTCVGFVWMGYRIIKGEWRKHFLIWGWTAIYFCWQSINFSRSMRYQILVYPTLVIIAAWVIIELWHYKNNDEKKIYLNSNNTRDFKNYWNKLLDLIICGIVLAATFIWAFAFTRIYTRPVTRIEASKWIYQNVPAPINLKIRTTDGIYNQPQPYPLGNTISYDKPLVIAFEPFESGELTKLNLSYIIDSESNEEIKTIEAEIKNELNAEIPLDNGVISNNFFSQNVDKRGDSYSIDFKSNLLLKKGETYYLSIKVKEPGASVQLSGPMMISINSSEDEYQYYLPDPVNTIDEDEEIFLEFTALYDGELENIYLPKVVDWEANHEDKTIRFIVVGSTSDDSQTASAEITGEFLPDKDGRGKEYSIIFEEPIKLVGGEQYSLQITHVDGAGALAIYGSKPANESSWDDALPLNLDGYDPFDYSMGVYRSELNFELYWDDNEEKRQRFINTLDQADYIFISSNRQWGSTVRIPERYPMTTAYYRDLLGCPEDREISWCYSVAQPGLFLGKLGYELEAVFQSEPAIGNWTFNTQFAEEAFTVYDHPKVLIFKKSQNYNAMFVRDYFNSFDLTRVLHIMPGKAKSYPANLMLPDNIWTKQQNNGTWSELFDRYAFFNQYQFAGVLLWYLTVSVLGWICYPFTRLALAGLADKGFPFVRTIGLLLLTYLVWLGGSHQIPFTQTSVWIGFSIILVINCILFWFQRETLLDEIGKNRNYIILVEVLALIFFILFLLIRLGNPDLWHPYKGGEKPMDFSYFNAVLKSVSFPPYNPWFAGGYINYYYYGFVLVGVLVKGLGLLPSFAYNLILPTLFSLFALGAFSLGWNLIGQNNSGYKVDNLKRDIEKQAENNNSNREHIRKNLFFGLHKNSIAAGLCASISALILGNLGTVRMIWQGIQKLAAPGGNIDGVNLFQNIKWGFEGLFSFVKGTPFSYYVGDWYWIPSRVYQENAITEFPMFSFLYADMHAHLIALPVTLLALGWALSVLMNNSCDVNDTNRMRLFKYIICFLLGGIVIGALRPINTWDFPTYLLFGVIVVFYCYGIRSSSNNNFLTEMPKINRQLLMGFGSVILLISLSFLLYSPFSKWFGQAYTSIQLWEGEHADISSYLVHWGLFLFLIGSWFVWETLEWMEITPAASLRKFHPYKTSIEIGFLILVLSIIGLCIMGVVIACFVIPLIIWAGILLFKPKNNDLKRFVLLLIGTGLFLTLIVELVVLQGDIGRMNTVFKFYLQAWSMLSISAAVSLVYLYTAVNNYCGHTVRSVWNSILVFLVVGAAFFPVMATVDKIRDRISKETPITLDGMDYMAYSQYNDAIAAGIDLIDDYLGIIWMQDHVKGTPVIVEANAPEYRWGSRYSIYTGLPCVVGWNWHQRQQLSIMSSDRVTMRIDEVREFYQSVDYQLTIEFLKKYNIQYIVLGKYENAYYPGEGLAKFESWNGMLWDKVYQNASTAIYKVVE